MEQRYTLTLPTDLYEQLRQEADRRGLSIKELTRQCLKFSLYAMDIDARSDADLLIREHVGETTRETLLKFL